jgi:hypothetical protein
MISRSGSILSRGTMAPAIAPKKDREIQKIDIARQGEAVNF